MFLASLIDCSYAPFKPIFPDALELTNVQPRLKWPYETLSGIAHIPTIKSAKPIRLSVIYITFLDLTLDQLPVSAASPCSVNYLGLRTHCACFMLLNVFVFSRNAFILWLTPNFFLRLNLKVSLPPVNSPHS